MGGCCMRRVLGTSVAVVALSAFIGACSFGGNGTPAPGPPAPAFEMVVVGEVPCPPATTATACLRVRVTNRGDAPGDGFCRLRGHEEGAKGEDIAVFGEGLALTDVAPGATVVDVLAWTEPLPDPPVFGADCEPTLRS